MKNKEELYERLQEKNFFAINLYVLMESILITNLLNTISEEKVGDLSITVNKIGNGIKSNLIYSYNFLNKKTKEQLNISFTANNKDNYPLYTISTGLHEDHDFEIDIKKELTIKDSSYCTTKIFVSKRSQNVFEYYHSQHFSKIEEYFDITDKKQDELYYEIALEIKKNKMITEAFDELKDLLLLKSDCVLDKNTYDFLKENFGKETLIQKTTNLIENLKQQPVNKTQQIVKTIKANEAKKKLKS